MIWIQKNNKDKKFYLSKIYFNSCEGNVNNYEKNKYINNINSFCIITIIT